jgi:lysophospholipase L1-like esterase
MNWGVAAFSTFQGLKRLRYGALPYHCDIYTIYFGWNDHWIQGGVPDDDRAAKAANSPAHQALGHLRLVQGADLIVETLKPKPAPQFRVPLKAYRQNLREMVRLARDAGGRVLLITAPGCLGDDRPLERLVIGLEATGYPNVTALHADYVKATREVSRETGADLLDAARYFAQEIDGCKYFVAERDPVHLTDDGQEIIAELIADQLIRSGWLAVH